MLSVLPTSNFSFDNGKGTTRVDVTDDDGHAALEGTR